METEIRLADMLRREDPALASSLSEIQRIFSERGFSLYLVGGAVRNLALGTALSDCDLASDARPEDVMSMFRSVIPTGIKHGTVTLIFRKTHFEITTFRVDGTYSDARRPDAVAFTPDILEDLKRRDFTINAMAMNLADGEVLDPHDGRGDLGRRLIRTVGDPLERFSEDGLRIVRGIRFAAQLGFLLDEPTKAAMSRRLDRLASVSIERFREEFFKILLSPAPGGSLLLMKETGVLNLFLAEIAGRDDIQALAAWLDRSPRALAIRLAILFSGPMKTKAETLLLRLKAPTVLIRRAAVLASWSDFTYDSSWSDAEMRSLASRMGRDAVSDVTVLLDAREPQGTLSARLEKIVSDNCALSVGELDIDGEALAGIGVPKGPVLGEILRTLLKDVLIDPTLNTKQALLDRAAAIYAEKKKN